jgi:tetratricopeptide (TPR) repeat protein
LPFEKPDIPYDSSSRPPGSTSINANSVILKTAVTASNPQTAESLSEQGLTMLAAGSPLEAADAFRAAIAADGTHTESHHGLIRALRDAGQLNQSVAAAMRLAALTPADPLAQTALSISLQAAGQVPEAEAAAARARILEWKAQLQSPPEEDSLS